MINANASFYTIVDFLYRVEQMKREVVIDDLSLDAGDYPILSAAIQGRTFMVIEKEAPAAQPSDGSSAAAGGTPAQAGAQAPASP